LNGTDQKIRNAAVKNAKYVLAVHKDSKLEKEYVTAVED